MNEASRGEGGDKDQIYGEDEKQQIEKRDTYEEIRKQERKYSKIGKEKERWYLVSVGEIKEEKQNTKGITEGREVQGIR